MRFLQATPLRLIRRQRLAQLLLLLLRVLALLILGLAFARPFLRGEAPVALLGQSEKSIALVVDASASMMAGDKAAAAERAAEAVLARAGNRDRVSVVAAGNTPRVLLEGGSAMQARTALAALRPQAVAGDLREAVLMADNILRRRGAAAARQGELHIISDLQRSNSPTEMVILSSEAQAFASEAIPSWQNVAVLDGRLGDAPACRVKNFNGAEQAVDVAWVVGERRRQQRISLPAGEERIVQFEAADAGDRGGYFEARAAVDDFPEDNRFFVAAARGGTRNLLAIRAEREPLFFVREAFSVPGARFRLVETPAAQMGTLTEYDCLLLISVSGLNRQHVERLKDYVRNGGGLILAPSVSGESRSSQDAAAWNLLLSELMPAALQMPVPGSPDRERPRQLVDVDFGHPVFKLFADPGNGDPTRVRFYQFWSTATSGASSGAALASFDDGHAALLERAVGKGRVLLWTGGFDARSSDLPLRPIFLPLMYQMAEYTARPRSLTPSLVTGQPILLDGFNPSQEIEVLLPDASRQQLTPGTMSFTPSSAGPYYFRQQALERIVAVNLDRRESDPQAMSAADFLAHLSRHADETPIAGIFGSTEVSRLDRERAQKLWRWALTALLVLLFAEGWLAKKTPR